MRNAPPLVSVIIPTRNRAALLRRAVRSVLEQSYSDFECFVVDDASEDETRDVVETFRDSRVSYLRRTTCGGASAARNDGIRRARGDYIAFLDDDDEWQPTKLELQVSLLRSLPRDFGLVYTWMDYFNPDGEIVRMHRPVLRGYVFGSVLDRQRIGGCPTLLVRREIIDRVGGFDESLPRGNDGDFIRRICLHYKVDVIPEVLVKVHVDHGYGRITSSGSDGIRQAIQGQKTKLEKFEAVLSTYPRETAWIESRIAANYGQLGEWRAAAHYHARAWRTAPFQPEVYRGLWRTFKERFVRH